MTVPRGLASTAVVVAAMFVGGGEAVAQSTIIDVDPIALAVTLPAEESVEVHIPFTSTGDTPMRQLDVSVASVTRDSTPLNTENPPVTASADVDVSRIVLTVDIDALTRPGAYLVTLRASSGSTSQLIGVTMTRAPAVIEAPDQPIEIERTVLFPEILDEWSETEDPPVVVRAGFDTRITDLTASPIEAEEEYVIVHPRDVDHDDASSTDADGSVVVTLIPTAEGDQEVTALGPGVSMELVESIVGDTPLGTVDRTVRLESAQFSEPVDVQFRITTRRHRILIPILTVLGIFLGLIARRLPNWLRQRRDAHARYRELKRQLKGLESNSDTRLANLAKQHLQALKWPWFHKIATVNANVDAAIDALNAQLEVTAAEITALRPQFDEHSIVLGREWAVPPDTTAVLSRARAGLVTLHRHEGASDVRQLETALRTLDNEMGEVLRRSVESDGQTLAAGLGALGEALESWDDSAVRATSSLIAQAATRASTRPESSATGEAHLEWLHNLAAHTRNICDRLIGHLETLIQEIRQDQVLVDAARQSFETIEKSVSTLRAPDGHLRLETLAPALGAALEDFGDLVHGDATTDELEGRTAAQRSIARPALVLAQVRAPVVHRVTAAPAMVGWAATSFLVGVVRFVVMLGFVTAIAYGWIAAEWIGDLSDITTILVWAFGVDLTTEFLTRARSQNPFAMAPSGVAPAPARPAAPKPPPAPPTREQDDVIEPAPAPTPPLPPPSPTPPPPTDDANGDDILMTPTDSDERKRDDALRDDPATGA